MPIGRIAVRVCRYQDHLRSVSSMIANDRLFYICQFVYSQYGGTACTQAWDYVRGYYCSLVPSSSRYKIEGFFLVELSLAHGGMLWEMHVPLIGGLSSSQMALDPSGTYMYIGFKTDRAFGTRSSWPRGAHISDPVLTSHPWSCSGSSWCSYGTFDDIALVKVAVSSPNSVGSWPSIVWGTHLGPTVKDDALYDLQFLGGHLIVIANSRNLVASPAGIPCNHQGPDYPAFAQRDTAMFAVGSDGTLLPSAAPLTVCLGSGGSPVMQVIDDNTAYLYGTFQFGREDRYTDIERYLERVVLGIPGTTDGTDGSGYWVAKIDASSFTHTHSPHVHSPHTAQRMHVHGLRHSSAVCGYSIKIWNTNVLTLDYVLCRGSEFLHSYMYNTGIVQPG